MEFKKVKLQDIVTILGDGIHGTPKYTENGEYYFINGNNLANGKIIIKSDTKTVDYEEYKKYKKDLNDRTLLVSINGTLGNVAVYNGEKCILGKSACYFNIKENVDKQYIQYILYSKEFQKYIQDYSTGTTIKNMSLKAMREYEFILPEIEVQNKITKILSGIDKKIELNNHINDNLYNQAVAIYKDRFQNTNQEICSIGDYLVPRRGKNLLSRDAILGDVPVIAGGLEPATYHNASNTKAPVITISASGANAGYINLWNVPVWSSDSSYIDNDITENVYFWYVTLKTRQKEIFDAQTGSAQPHIYPQHIAELPINKLENEDVFKYEKQVEPLFKMIGKNKEENKYLEQLRDTLLPKLMNGEIDLDKIEI